MIKSPLNLKQKKGGVLVEFAFSALLFFTVLIGTVEFTLESYVRHATERALATATHVYAVTGDKDLALDKAKSETVYIVDRCLTLDIRIFDTIRNVDILTNASGRAPDGTAADDSATIARIYASCNWDRFSPVMATILGQTMVYETRAVTGLR